MSHRLLDELWIQFYYFSVVLSQTSSSWFLLSPSTTSIRHERYPRMPDFPLDLIWCQYRDMTFKKKLFIFILFAHVGLTTSDISSVCKMSLLYLCADITYFQSIIFYHSVIIDQLIISLIFQPYCSFCFVLVIFFIR